MNRLSLRITMIETVLLQGQPDRLQAQPASTLRSKNSKIHPKNNTFLRTVARHPEGDTVKHLAIG
jgi:hypothetical protein